MYQPDTSRYERWVRCPEPAVQEPFCDSIMVLFMMFVIYSQPQLSTSGTVKRSAKRSRGPRVVPAKRACPPAKGKFLELRRVYVAMGDPKIVRVPFRVTFAEGYMYPIPFCDPLVGLLSPMTSVEASWLVSAMPRTLMEHFEFDTIVALVAGLCPVHLWNILEMAPLRVRAVLEEFWEECKPSVPLCVYCGQGHVTS
ncbi:uncharacterized protein LOC130674206 [Microplitis mediator]|uniref:uncharacterized protein LOC130674206 n=1 Tax=Microplitis mediator TaxID=375433 RepID=UPI0025542E75|nr:uncharacterized protein LOC130674206 [Microplitis mediator]